MSLKHTLPTQLSVYKSDYITIPKRMQTAQSAYHQQ